jgi:hypothetical protein
VFNHLIIPGEVNYEQKSTYGQAQEREDPEKQFFFPHSKVNDDCPQTIEGMEHDQNNE